MMMILTTCSNQHSSKYILHTQLVPPLEPSTFTLHYLASLFRPQRPWLYCIIQCLSSIWCLLDLIVEDAADVNTDELSKSCNNDVTMEKFTVNINWALQGCYYFTACINLVPTGCFNSVSNHVLKTINTSLQNSCCKTVTKETQLRW